jgi:hypothetical protein
MLDDLSGGNLGSKPVVVVVALFAGVQEREGDRFGGVAGVRWRELRVGLGHGPTIARRTDQERIARVPFTPPAIIESALINSSAFSLGRGSVISLAGGQVKRHPYHRKATSRLEDRKRQRVAGILSLRWERKMHLS